jgi:NitT/TauT family transport system permease protein
MSGTTQTTSTAKAAARAAARAGEEPRVTRQEASVTAGVRRRLLGRRSGRAVLVLVCQVMVVLGILVAWQLASGRVVQAYLVSNPIDVAKKLWTLLGDASMRHNIWITTQELVLGYLLGAVSGIVVGWALGTVRFAGDVFEPIISAFNGIPKVALAPLFLLWFGLGVGSKVAIAGMIVFFVLYYNVYTGMRTVPSALVDVTRAMDASPWFIIRRIVLPSVSVALFAGLKAGVPFAMIGVIAGEFISADAGLGYYTMTATQQFDPAGLFAGLVIIVVMLLIGTTLVSIVERRALAWQRI